MDGFLICTMCSTQQENFEEMEADDDAEILNRTKLKTEKPQTVKVSEAPIKKRKVEELWKNSQFGQSDTRPTLETMRKPWVRGCHSSNRVDARLSMFVDILARATECLVTYAVFPHAYSTAVYNNMHSYFVHCGIVAKQNDIEFAERKLSIDFSKQVKMSIKNQKKRSKKSGKKEEVETLCSSMATWNALSMQKPFGQMDSSSSEEEQIEEFAEVDEEGNIHPNILDRGSRILLDMDLIVALLYISALQAGAQDLTLSDFVRWIREDRFRITVGEMNFLTFRKRDVVKIGRPGTSIYMRLPSAEFYRINYLTQKSISNFVQPDVLKIAARMVVHLNLPSEILRKVYVLHDLMPVTDMPPIYKDHDRGIRLSTLATVSDRNQTEHLVKCFGEISYASGQTTLEGTILSVEAKALALILLSLKLHLPLDDSVVETKKGEFNVELWLRQLGYRICSWQRQDMSEVMAGNVFMNILGVKLAVEPHMIPRHDTNNWKSFYTKKRRLGFMDCVPYTMKLKSSHNNPDIFKKTQFESWEDDSLFSPLEYQCKLLRDQMAEEPERFVNVSKESVTLFHHEFNRDFIKESGEYTKYKRPEYAQLCWVQYKHEKNIFDKNVTFSKLNGTRLLYPSVKLTEDLFKMAQTSFSNQFESILKLVCLVYGEDVKDVYMAMVMAEIQLMSVERMKMIKETFLSGLDFPMKTFYIDSYSVEMKIGNVNVSSAKPINHIEELREIMFGNVIVVGGNESTDEESTDEDGLTDFEIDEEEEESDPEERNDEQTASDSNNLEFTGKKKRKHLKAARLKTGFDFEPVMCMLSHMYW